MKRYRAYAHDLPRVLSAPLFGDRSQFGRSVVESDPCWQEYLQKIDTFYVETQRGGIGKHVNDAGYRILRDISLDGKRVLEIGPGGFHHVRFWQDKPNHYTLVDLYEDYLLTASSKLKALQVPHVKLIATREGPGSLPVETESIDLILNFFSFEHLFPFQPHLAEMSRVLKPGGQIIGAIPAEGGLAWGLGRYLTTRRWFLRNTTINPDKIICWEHPNFADEILNLLGAEFQQNRIDFWPLAMPTIDLNLVIKFIYSKNIDV